MATLVSFLLLQPGGPTTCFLPGSAGGWTPPRLAQVLSFHPESNRHRRALSLPLRTSGLLRILGRLSTPRYPRPPAALGIEIQGVGQGRKEGNRRGAGWEREQTGTLACVHSFQISPLRPLHRSSGSRSCQASVRQTLRSRARLDSRSPHSFLEQTEAGWRERDQIKDDTSFLSYTNSNRSVIGCPDDCLMKDSEAGLQLSRKARQDQSALPCPAREGGVAAPESDTSCSRGCWSRTVSAMEELERSGLLVYCNINSISVGSNWAVFAHTERAEGEKGEG